jgi:hypothetical protein
MAAGPIHHRWRLSRTGFADAFRRGHAAAVDLHHDLGNISRPDLNSCRQIPARFLRYLVVFVEVELSAVFRRNAK